MSLFTKIGDILSELSYLPYMETVEGHWTTLDVDTVYYIVNDEVWCSEIKEGVIGKDDCFIINTDNGCGETVTLVCKAKNRLTYDDFYDKYEDCM